jgi:hypothetical protein
VPAAAVRAKTCVRQGISYVARWHSLRDLAETSEIAGAFSKPLSRTRIRRVCRRSWHRQFGMISGTCTTCNPMTTLTQLAQCGWARSMKSMSSSLRFCECVGWSRLRSVLLAK